MNCLRRPLVGELAALRTVSRPQCQKTSKSFLLDYLTTRFSTRSHSTAKATHPTEPPSSIPIRSRLFSSTTRKATATRAAYLAGGLTLLVGLAYANSHKSYAGVHHGGWADGDVEKRAIKEVTGGSTETPGADSYRLSDIRKEHGPTSANPWVIRGNKVYDITDWVAGHPGGEVILRAAGGPVEPYWAMFKVHDSQYVLDILEQFLVGIVDPRDLVDGKVPASSIEDPFANDPRRDSRLRVLSSQPCNAETPGEHLSDFNTPTELLYVRNHFWVPNVKSEDHRLMIELYDGTEVTYSMQELRSKFPKYTISSVMQCSGNRRNNMTRAVKATNGLQWTVGGIGNVTWSGVRLRDVLNDAGFSVSDPSAEAKHVQFSALEAYGASIPIDKAIDARDDVILAYEMNGKDLTPDHGYPLRVVVPGYVAARSVKWVNKISISDEESTSQWQRRDYKCFGPNETGKEDWAKAKSIQEMPVTSAITAFRHRGAEQSPMVEGYAYSGGGHEIVRVDISTDGGKSWNQAQLFSQAQPGSKEWSWKRWTFQIPADQKSNNMELVCKATDEAYNTQPERHEGIYNARGNLATAWHRVKIKDGKIEGSL